MFIQKNSLSENVVFSDIQQCFCFFSLSLTETLKRKCGQPWQLHSWSRGSPWFLTRSLGRNGIRFLRLLVPLIQFSPLANVGHKTWRWGLTFTTPLTSLMWVARWLLHPRRWRTYFSSFTRLDPSLSALALSLAVEIQSLQPKTKRRMTGLGQTL